MSEKVKVTREQADALAKVRELADNELDRFSLLKIVDLANSGYEVEPEFEVGDWIKNLTNGDIGVITDMGSTYIKYDDGYSDGIHAFRHATEPEIAAEKERRWWGEHGRKVWELKIGDVLLDDNYNVTEVVKNVLGNGEEAYIMDNGLNIEDIENISSVVCFVENRLDGDFNE